ncbi:MAG: hypothetical protein ACK4NP_10110 [Parvularculaceae bacterium]
MRLITTAAILALVAGCGEASAPDADAADAPAAKGAAAEGPAPGPAPAEQSSAAGDGLSLAPDAEDVFSPEEIEAAREAARKPQSAPGSFSVCDAISAGQLSEIIGQPMGEAVGEGPGCMWSSTLPASDPKSKRVMIIVMEAANFARAPGGVEAVLRQQSDVTTRFDDDGAIIAGDPSKAEAVEGVGEQAFWRGVLAFRKGAWVANIDLQPRAQLYGSEVKLDPTDKAPEIAIGKLLAAALP